jgi:hypothetical protein
MWSTERFDEALVPDWRTSLLRSVGVLFGLVTAGIAIVVILALVAPSAGAAGGCGGG